MFLKRVGLLSSKKYDELDPFTELNAMLNVDEYY
jgi:hypothetical protein